MELENNELSNQNEDIPISDVNNNFEKGDDQIIEKSSKPRCCPIRPSTTLNIILIVAVAVLYFLHFHTSSKESATVSSVGNGNLKVAFFNIDSVSQNYEKANQLQVELKKEKESLEAVFNNKQATYQTKVQNYQSNLKNNAITPVQVQNAENQLMKERNDIMKMNDEYTQQLMAKQADNTKIIWEEIVSFVKKFNEKYGADYILDYTNTIGGSLIYASPKMDITKEITEGLNKAYKENKGK